MWIFGVAGLGELEHHGIALGRQPTLACRSGDHRDLVVGVVEEVLQLVLGERSLGWRLFVFLYVRGRVPLEVFKDTIQPFPTFAEAFLHALLKLESEVSATA